MELISFIWLEKDDDDDDEVDDDNNDDNDEEDNNKPGNLDTEFDSMPSIKAVKGEHYTTPPTIWVDVLPTTFSSAAVCDLATEILGFVSQYNLTGIDVAFQESEAQLLSTGAPLFAPVNNYDRLKSVINDLSTVLPLPIAGIKTPMQGTLTCFFWVGKELYAITAAKSFLRMARMMRSTLSKNVCIFLCTESTSKSFSISKYPHSHTQERCHCDGP